VFLVSRALSLGYRVCNVAFACYFVYCIYSSCCNVDEAEIQNAVVQARSRESFPELYDMPNDRLGDLLKQAPLEQAPIALPGSYGYRRDTGIDDEAAVYIAQIQIDNEKQKTPPPPEPPKDGIELVAIDNNEKLDQDLMRDLNPVGADDIAEEMIKDMAAKQKEDENNQLSHALEDNFNALSTIAEEDDQNLSDDNESSNNNNNNRLFNTDDDIALPEENTTDNHHSFT
jgi:hypothetical protein